MADALLQHFRPDERAVLVGAGEPGAVSSASEWAEEDGVSLLASMYASMRERDGVAAGGVGAALHEGGVAAPTVTAGSGSGGGGGGGTGGGQWAVIARTNSELIRIAYMAVTAPGRSRQPRLVRDRNTKGASDLFRPRGRCGHHVTLRLTRQ